MDGREFFQCVADDADLEWLGAKKGKTPDEDSVLIGSKKSPSKFSLNVSAIQDHGWSELRSVFVGHRMPTIMSKITRIVGYFANLANFNKSKQQEVIDRRRGNYILSGDGHVYDREKAFADSTCLPELQRTVPGTPVGESEEVLLPEVSVGELEEWRPHDGQGDVPTLQGGVRGLSESCTNRLLQQGM